MHGPEIFVPIFFLGAVAAVWITRLSTRHRERMAMVEKGLSSEEIKAMYLRDVKRDPLASLKWGLLFVLAGVAIMLGNFLHDRYGVDKEAIVGMVILFVGIGLVAFYSIAAKKTGE
ncbi:MAG TPA: DUF6249 domain-containing protein [Bacteroidota bacterium]|jgi:hypothetical protein|nr:DUF6249 domain-containing protein [Bacteroidota bacterium]